MLFGNGGNDTLTGDIGNDALDGGGGSNTLAESGNVNFILTNSTLTGVGTDTLANLQVANLTGGAGNNVFTVSGWTGDGTIDGAGGTADKIVAVLEADLMAKIASREFKRLAVGKRERFKGSKQELQHFKVLP